MLKCFLLLFILFNFSSFVHASPHWFSVETPTKESRTKLSNLGIHIEKIIDGISYGVTTKEFLEKIKKTDLKLLSSFQLNSNHILDYPEEDSIYHNYDELEEAIQELAENYPSILSVSVIGKTHENRNIYAIRISSQKEKKLSSLPGIIFMGGHHAREHLSVEIPLLTAKFLAENYGSDETITQLVNTREIFIIPLVNPDGAEHDIADGSYKWWRKNRKTNSRSRCPGVDLNRNYGFMFDTGGSSSNECADTYHGGTAFSEPETKAIKKFVESKLNAKILLSFHTYSELILYPWGHKYDPIENQRDHDTYVRMATRMSEWNNYTPQQSSGLYIASGDTTDWSYGELGLISFTFELSPSRWGGGGFYPGPTAIESTFQDNIKPILYLIDLADNPHRSVVAPETTLFYGI